MKFFSSLLNRSSLCLAAGLFLTFLGVQAFRGMPRSLFPEVDYPRVSVQVNMGFAPLQTMEWGVTALLEKELRAVPGVRLVKSSSSRGMSGIDVFLREGEDVSQAVQRVNAKVAEARALLPAAAVVTVRPISAAAFPAAEYCFTSKTLGSRELRAFVEYTIRPLVMVVPGIFDAKIAGGDLPEFSVELDPAKLAARNLSVTDINDRLRNSNGVDFLGPVDQAGAQVLAFGGRFVGSAEDIGRIVVDSSLGQSVRLSDLGRVTLTNEWKTKDVGLNGEPCVALDVYYQAGIDQKITSGGVLAAVNAVVEKNPSIKYRSWDLNDFTDAATNAVLLDLFVGMVIIAGVSMLFLRNLRYSLIALLSMPVAASLTFLAMSRLGLSINLMTLGGLTAALGLVVDNTVIVLEMFHHRKTLSPGTPARELLVETLNAVFKPMVFGTATIALVFTPIGYLSGVSGMFFAPMAHVHGASLVISVLLAIFFVPALILLLAAPTETAPAESHADFAEARFARLYGRGLSWLLGRSKLASLPFLLVPLAGVLLLPLAQTGFLPEWDEGDIVVDFRATTPIPLATTVAKIKPVEAFLQTIPEIDFFVRKVGTGLGSYDKSPYDGEIIVKLKKRRSRSVFEIRDQISARAPELAEGLEFDLFQILPDRLNDLSGSAKPIVVYLRSDDETKLDAAAETYRALLAGVKGLDSVRIEEPAPAPELLFTPDETLTRALEMNPTALDENVRFGLYSLDSSSVQVGPQSIPIRLRSLKKAPVASLAAVPVYTPRGGLEAISRIGKVSTVNSRVESSHIDGTPVRTITAEIAGRDLGSVVADIRSALAAHPTLGVYLSLAGDYEMQQRSFSELLVAFGTGIVIIFLMSLAFSNRLSVAIPLTASAGVPPVVGLLGCLVFRIPLDVSSFSGLISVTGIAVANSFMALAAIESHPEASRTPQILHGMMSRLRPILMTNLAAMAGFVPIAIGLAQGDEILRPFSIAIIVGLFGAIYTTLALFPLLYGHFAREPLPLAR